MENIAGQGPKSKPFNGVSVAPPSRLQPNHPAIAIDLGGVTLPGLAGIARNLADEQGLNYVLGTSTAGASKHHLVVRAANGSEQTFVVYGDDATSNAFCKELVERLCVCGGCTKVDERGWLTNDADWVADETPVKALPGSVADYAPAKTQPARNLQCDFGEANRFLVGLDGGDRGRFTFQMFDDNAQRKDSNLARQFHGPFDQHATALARMNERGAGIFVTINETDLRGRRAANVRRVRALLVDLDGAPIEPVLAWKIQPHIVVESSRNRFHAYWRVGDVSLDQFKGLQRKLAALFGGDTAVNDLPRVMRLPGFWHQKVSREGVRSEPFQTVIRDRGACHAC